MRPHGRASRSGALRIALAVLALTVPGALAGSRPADAAGPAVRFGTPTASATWGSGVEFRQPVDLGGPVRRVELVLTSPFDPFGSVIVPIEVASSGSITLRRVVGEGDLRLRPNTTLRGAWRVVAADGSSVTGPSLAVTYRDTRFEWRSLAGATVRVHWYRGDEAFGRRALAIGEEAIRQTASLLGVRETQPVDFFIYAEQGAFYDALGPGTRENVGGQANPEIRTLFALIAPSEIDARWVATVIPHELAHLVFDTAVANPYRQPPTWLNEGLAVYLAQGYDAEDRAQVRSAVAAGTLMPLAALTGMFPTTRERFSLAYAESVSAIDFLVRTHGKAALVRLVRDYASGVSDDEATLRALGQDVTAFEAAWLADLGAAVPTRYGPRPAPAGPLPAAWGGTAASDGTGSGSSSDGAGDGGGSAAPRGEEGSSLDLLLAAVVGAVGIWIGRRLARRRPVRTGPE